MTKEKLQAKLLEYQAAFDQAKANANALQGAIQDVQFWLAELEKESVAVAPPPTVS